MNENQPADAVAAAAAAVLVVVRWGSIESVCFDYVAAVLVVVVFDVEVETDVEEEQTYLRS